MLISFSKPIGVKDPNAAKVLFILNTEDLFIYYSGSFYESLIVESDSQTIAWVLQRDNHAKKKKKWLRLTCL